jgi:hypothetical protein
MNEGCKPGKFFLMKHIFLIIVQENFPDTVFVVGPGFSSCIVDNLDLDQPNYQSYGYWPILGDGNSQFLKDDEGVNVDSWYVCVCVCVYVIHTKREREGEREGER